MKQYLLCAIRSYHEYRQVVYEKEKISHTLLINACLCLPEPLDRH